MGGKQSCDAWGNVLTTTGSSAGSLGKYNPLRYRGYIYDVETKLYYLQSRYYNPEWGRFINADAMTSTGHNLLGNNMFAYCNNNPVNCDDYFGTLPDPIIDGIVAGTVSLLCALCSGSSFEEACGSFVSGFFQGATVSYTNSIPGLGWVKYGFILWDVATAVYECWKTGASTEECVIVALTQLSVALSFDSLDTTKLFDSTIGLGLALTGTAVTEGVKQSTPLTAARRIRPATTISGPLYYNTMSLINYSYTDPDTSMFR